MCPKTQSKKIIESLPKHIKCALELINPQERLPGREMTQSFVMINKKHFETKKKYGKNLKYLLFLTLERTKVRKTDTVRVG